MTRSLSYAIVLLLVLAACGGGDSSDAPDSGGSGDADAPTATTAGSEEAPEPTSAPETTAAPDTGESGAQGSPEVTEMGFFTVNESEFAVTFLNRCIPFEGEDSEVIDLQPLAQGQGAKLNLYGTAESLEVSIDGSTITQDFGSRAFSADSFDGGIESTIEGDRWTGSATLNDVLDEADPVVVTWDVMIPEEIVDCGL